VHLLQEATGFIGSAVVQELIKGVIRCSALPAPRRRPKELVSAEPRCIAARSKILKAFAAERRLPME